MKRVIFVILCLPLTGLAAEPPFSSYVGRSVGVVIDSFREAGHPFAYSTNLVPGDLLATIEPTSADPLEIVRQILKPHGLTLRLESGIYLVVRIEKPPASAPTATSEVAPAIEVPLEMITVSASRYEVSRDIAASKFTIDQRTIQDMPDIGEDPVRIAHRVPGAAASGATAKTHFRGGEDGEIGIMLNGQLLFEPFHVRDYQSIFSSIDSRAIEGIEVYTGGFPVQYGDRMSGMLLLKSLEPMRPRRNEIGISVLNTSVLTAGSTSDFSWLFSARRSNLDIVVDSKFGDPSYYDVFAEFAYNFSGDTRLSVNALYADDSISLVLDSNPDELERIESDTKNAQFWIQLDSRWSPKLTSSTVLSLTSFSNRRDGVVNELDRMVGSVLDDRGVQQWGLRQEWAWNASDEHLVQWGVVGLFSRAQYDYASTAQYFGLPTLYPGQPDTISRQVSAVPEGGSYAIYFSDRMQLAKKTVIEWGLRWDDQTYTGLTSDSQLSPRFSILQAIGPRTEFRLSWGRYYQSQGIQELQVEDGLSNFWPAQRADHMIAGIRQRIADDYSVRVELFRKDIGRIRPRFENLFDPLALIPELEPDRVRLDPESAKSEGLEISIDRLKRPWTWWASYTLSKTTDRINGRDEARSWDQRHAFQGGVGWSNDAWSLSAAASVRNGWPTSELNLVADGTSTDGNPAYSVVPGPRNATRYGTFSSIDVRLSRSFDVRRGSLLAFIEISNLANRRNECCIEWELIEDENGNRALERDASFWLPLLPTFGVLWEF